MAAGQRHASRQAGASRGREASVGRVAVEDQFTNHEEGDVDRANTSSARQEPTTSQSPLSMTRSENAYGERFPPHRRQAIRSRTDRRPRKDMQPPRGAPHQKAILTKAEASRSKKSAAANLKRGRMVLARVPAQRTKPPTTTHTTITSAVDGFSSLQK
jgi:hypothetical protein